MKQLTAIAWKEWRENSPLLWIALGVFLGLPMIGGVEYMVSGLGRHHFEISALPGVIALGGVFAIFVAVGATCRDLNGKLEDFWRSRPVTGVQWMLVKFIVGLAVVLSSLLIPLLVSWLTDRSTYANFNLLEVMRTLPLIWCLFYCIGFLAGCLLQRPAHAAVLALTALLLIHYVPTLLLPRYEFGISPLLVGGSALAETIEWGFGIASALFLLAMVAAQRQWRIEPGPKFMYGTIAAAFLIFLFSTGYRLGTNLPVLQQIDLMPNEEVETLYMDGAHGYVVTGKYVEGWPQASGPAGYFRQLNLAADGLHLGPPLPMWAYYPKGNRQTWFYGFWLPMNGYRNRVRRGGVEYVYYFDESLRMGLDAISFKDIPMGKIAKSIQLPIKVASENEEPNPVPYIWDNRLYLIGYQFMVTIDISQPLSPQVVSSVPTDYSMYAHWLDDRTIAYDLPQIPGLPDPQRLQIAVKVEQAQLVDGTRWAGMPETDICDGRILCQSQGHIVTEFQLESLTHKLATFKRIGESGDLDSLFTWGQAYATRLQGDLLYLAEVRSDLNPVVKVYSTAGAGRPRAVGHFSAQSGQMHVEPLPDGRSIVAGARIWLVGPPPHHD